MPATNGQTATELYRKHRPTQFKEVLGQADAVAQLKKMLKEGLPHVLLLTGPSGCGKTTLARILRVKLGCGEHDWEEVNCASCDPMDKIRAIQIRMPTAPSANSTCRVWILDEAQAFSRASFAQQAMLKMLEDCPRHVWFILCTTDPAKLLPQVRNRCTEVKVKTLDEGSVKKLLTLVSTKEGISLDNDLANAIVGASDGCARQALQHLGKAAGLPTVEDQLKAVTSLEEGGEAYNLVKFLVWGREEVTWQKVAEMINSLEDKGDWEGFRRLILANATKELLKPGSKRHARAAALVAQFSGHWFDCGKAGLALACWEFVASQK